MSANGVVMTANHVVTTRESGFRQYAPNINIVVLGRPTTYQAKPLMAEVSDEQRNYDFVVLKIITTKFEFFPHVELGSWDEANIGDRIIVVPNVPNLGSMMLEGIVSNRTAFRTGFGPRPVNTILFQSPMRNGFSGSPIFGLSGRVVGIVDTKVFGISEALDDFRKQLSAGQQYSRAIIQGVEFAPTVIELINVLDENLISGLGSGVSIEYAKKAQAEAEKKD